ncbi:MAG: sortase domain-containing protein [Acidimicrobiales bacterium]
MVVFALSAGLVLQLALVSAVQQRADQQQLYDAFRVRLADGTAPVGPTDLDGVAYPLGTPVAFLEIPAVSLSQVVVSGTSSEALFVGPGHRRDTVLPGQAGASIIMGRRAAYGGPFASIADLEEDDRIVVTTGQGEFEYRVVGVRREGDPIPPPIEAGQSRLVLTTADGPPFAPNGVLRVDALMEGAEPGSGRLLTSDGLPPPEDTMAGDTSELWALVLWLQALILVALAAVWAWHRWGRAQAWVVFLPPLMLVGISVSNQAARLLPNLL